MNVNEHRRLQSLIRKHMQAQVNLSWSGSKEPEERAEIEAYAKEAKQKLYSFMSLLIKR